MNSFDSLAGLPGNPPRIPGYQQQTHEDLSVELGDWWGFYRDFWKAHNLEHVAHLLPVAEVAIPRGGTYMSRYSFGTTQRIPKPST